VQLGDDIGDRCSYARNFLQPILGDKLAQGNGKRGKAICRARIGLGAVWVASA